MPISADIEKKIRNLLQQVRGKARPHSRIATDIEEFIAAYEWELALDHILDWAATEKKFSKISEEAEKIRAELNRSAYKQTD